MFFDPETMNKIIDVMPILSMGRDTSRRPAATRFAEHLIFSTVIATGVIWWNQRDEHDALSRMQDVIMQMEKRMDILEMRMAAHNPLADEELHPLKAHKR